MATTTGFAAQPGGDCAEPGEPHQPVPWAQQLLAPERVWPFTRGGGVTVAVLSTGVDAGHPQLAGRVAPGFDAVAGDGPADDDCLGAGTQVAGVIAASPAPGVGFAGIAPEVTILPVRVVDDHATTADSVDPVVLADGIRWAASNGAQVIDVAVAVHTDHPELRAAVDEALAAGSTVVSAVDPPASSADPPPGPVDPSAEPAGGADAAPYPAAYPGVIGVGAIDPQGARWDGSPPGDFVTVAAPGAGMVTLQRGGGMVVGVDGTGIASGVVAGAAALIHADRPGQAADLVARRLVATAAPAPSGAGFGHGVVDPYAAVTDTLVVEASPAPLPGLDRPADRPESAWVRARERAVAGTAVAALLVVAVIVVGQAVPRGQRRSWRTGRATPAPEAEALEPGPPVMLFDERR